MDLQVEDPINGKFSVFLAFLSGACLIAIFRVPLPAAVFAGIACVIFGFFSMLAYRLRYKTVAKGQDTSILEIKPYEIRLLNEILTTDWLYLDLKDSVYFKDKIFDIDALTAHIQLLALKMPEKPCEKDQLRSCPNS